jgi:hypothetical protein
MVARERALEPCALRPRRDRTCIARPSLPEPFAPASVPERFEGLNYSTHNTLSLFSSPPDRFARILPASGHPPRAPAPTLLPNPKERTVITAPDFDRISPYVSERTQAGGRDEAGAAAILSTSFIRSDQPVVRVGVY